MQRAQPKCTLCFDDFVEPRRLPCKETHIFCCKCIFHHIRGESEDEQFRCPLCDSQHSVPENGVSGVREQFPLATGLTTPQEVSEETSGSKVFCKVKNHHDKEVMVFCITHDKMICGNCLIEDHKKCDYSKFEDELPRQKAHIQELLMRVQQYSDDLKKLAEHTRTIYDKSDQDIEAMKKNIEKTFGQLQTTINKEKTILLNKVEKIKSQRKQREVTTSQEEGIQKADEIISSCLTLQKDSALGKILEEATAVKQEWENLQQNKVKTFSWVSSSEEMNKECDEWLGVVTSQVEIRKNDTRGRKDIGHEFTPRHLLSIPMKIENQDVSGIVEVEGAILCTQRCKDTVFIYSKDGEPLSEVPIQGLGDPWGGLVCLNNDSHANIELIISDRNNRSLHMVTLNRQWSLLKHKRKQLKYAPHGITLYQRDDCTELIVVDPDATKKVYIYDKDGVQKGTIKLKHGQFTSSYCVCKTKEGFIVSDCQQKKILWLDTTGNVMKSYSGAAEHKLKDSYKLTMDSLSGHVLIADYSGHDIHDVNMRGELTRNLATEEEVIKYPFAIHLGRSGRLYIGTWSSSGSRQVKVFQYRAPPQFQCATEDIAMSLKFKILRWK